MKNIYCEVSDMTNDNSPCGMMIKNLEFKTTISKERRIEAVKTLLKDVLHIEKEIKIITPLEYLAEYYDPETDENGEEKDLIQKDIFSMCSFTYGDFCCRVKAEILEKYPTCNKMIEECCERGNQASYGGKA